MVMNFLDKSSRANISKIDFCDVVGDHILKIKHKGFIT